MLYKNNNLSHTTHSTWVSKVIVFVEVFTAVILACTSAVVEPTLGFTTTISFALKKAISLAGIITS